MARKTLTLKDLVEYGNKQLARTDDHANNIEFKSGICVMLEFALHSADAYNGYSHLDVNDCKHNTIGDYSRKYWLPHGF
jgi:hypothetical protein